MKLEPNVDGTFTLDLTEVELEAIQAGLRETLEALEEWEFETRTGLTQDEMSHILTDLTSQKKSARTDSSFKDD